MSAVSPSSASDYSSAVAGHLRHYAALLEEQTPLLNGSGSCDEGRGQALATARLRQERENFLTAFQAALEGSQPDELSLLAKRLPALLLFVNELPELQAVCTAGLAACTGDAESQLEAQFRLGLTRVLTRQGQARKAMEHCQRAEQLALAAADEELLSAALHCRSSALAQLGEVEHARQAQQEALELWRVSGDQHALAIASISLGVLDQMQGRSAEALRQFDEAAIILRELGDSAVLGMLESNTGNALATQGLLPEALERYEAASRLAHQTGDTYVEAAVLNNIGLVKSMQGDRVAARQRFQQALVINQRTGNKSWEGNNLHNIARLDFDEGQPEKAIPVLEKVLRIRRATGDQRGESSSLLVLADVQLGRARLTSDPAHFAAARQLFEEAGAIAARLGDQPGHSASLEGLAAVALHSADSATAASCAGTALDIRCAIGDLAGQTTSLALCGCALAGHGNWPDAALALHGAAACAAALAYSLPRPELVAAGLELLDAAVHSGAFAAAELARIKLRAENLSQPELVDAVRHALTVALPADEQQQA